MKTVATSNSLRNSLNPATSSPATRSRNMRLRQLLLTLVAFVAFSIGAFAFPIVRVDIGRPSRGCQGFGICRIIIGANDPTGTARQAQTTLDGNQLTLAFLEPSSTQNDVLPIDAAMPLDSSVAHALGVSSIELLPGSYHVDYSNNPNGTVTIATQPAGFTIDVYIGRRSRGCSGFGICRIDINLDAAPNMDQATAVLKGNELTLDMLAPMPEKGTQLIIDEDIILSKQTSEALGTTPIKVLSGAYTVDYSNNPNGQVHLATESITITVDIKVGRKSKDCAGFGICDITISTNLIANPTLAAVSRDGDGLVLNMLEAMPSKGDSLTIDDDIVLDPETSMALGNGHSTTVLHGTYPVNYSVNVNGEVHVRTEAGGIITDVYVGNPNFKCLGIGICGIKIGLTNSNPDRNVPAVISLEQHKLKFQFAHELPEQGDTMTIDQNITLDPAIAQALNVHQAVIQHGKYLIERDPATGHPTVKLDVEAQGIVIVIRTGRRSRDCSGFGICSITTSSNNAGSEMSRAIGTLTGNTLTVDLLSLPAEHGDTLVIDEPIVLDDSTSLALGARKVTVLPGSYFVDYSKNPNGTVNVNALRFGITIGIEVGRPSKGCSGLGICSITIGVTLDMRGVPTVASLDNGKLSVTFLSHLPEDGNVMTIDSNIMLDPQVARSLGARSLMIKKGEYTIGRDAQGHPTVNLDVQQLGFVITIHVGRARLNCTGFGICSIVIGSEMDNPTARTVQAIAVMENGGITFDLTGTAPDQDSVLVVDSPIDLDSTMAAAFGITAGTITPGSYPVDYSASQYGTVRVPVRTGVLSSVTTGSLANVNGSAVALPNPTTGQTAISFNVRRGGQVSVTLSDANGRKVSQLADGVTMQAGRQNVSFDASRLPNGVYFYTIRSVTGVETGSVVVTR